MKSTSDLFDPYEGRIAGLEPLFTYFGGRQQFYGEAVTEKRVKDNFKVKQLAGTAGNKRVLVIDGSGWLRPALLGDMIVANALANVGWIS